MTETSTQEAVQHVPFKDRIKNIGRKELVKLAASEFKLNIDDNVETDVVRDQLLRCHEDKANQARTMNEAAAALFIDTDPEEKLNLVKFLPQDFPNASEEFVYDGGRGVRDKRNPGRNPSGLSKMARFRLIPGESYKLPICVIRHLESKTFRDSKPVFNNDGMIEENMPVIKARFMLQIQLDDDQLRDMGTRDI